MKTRYEASFRWLANVLVAAALFITLCARAAAAEKGVIAHAALPGSANQPAPGERATNPAPESALNTVKFPGMEINYRERCVDIDSSVCLHEGMLELVACTKGTKEHESIIAIEAKPMHVHAALLLLGAQPGHPAMRKPVGEKEQRWIDVPPSGGPVDVYLVFQSQPGNMVEHPISDFIVSSGKHSDTPSRTGEDVKFPTHTFLFAGSHLQGDGPGPRRYLSDENGNVISLATFGDELLCLSGMHSQDNKSLMWQVNAAGLPAVGLKVTLRLRPQIQPASKTGRNGQPTSVPAPEKVHQ